MAEERMVPVSIAMSEHLARKVRILAAMDGVSRSHYIREIVESSIRGQGSDGPRVSEASPIVSEIADVAA